MRKIFKNKTFWWNLVYLIILVLIIFDEPNYWKTMLFLVVIFSSPLPKLKKCFRADLQQPLPRKKGTYDYENGKLVFKAEEEGK